MKPLRLLLYCLLVITFLSPGRTVASQAQSSCGAAACIYLPLIEFTSPVEVNEYETQRSKSGSCQIIGDVINVSQIPLENVTLEARIYDAYYQPPQLVEVITGTTVLSTTLPDQLNPFYFLSASSCPAVDVSTEVKILSWKAASENNFLPLTIVSITPSTSCIFNAKVVFQNDNPIPLRDITGSIWSTDQPFGVVREPMPNLGPGESFELTKSTSPYCMTNVHAVAYGKPIVR